MKDSRNGQTPVSGNGLPALMMTGQKGNIMIEKVRVTNKQNPEIKAFPLKALDVKSEAAAVVVSAVDGSIRVFPYTEWKVEVMDWVELVEPSEVTPE